jgi:hypothetical protein
VRARGIPSGSPEPYSLQAPPITSLDGIATLEDLEARIRDLDPLRLDDPGRIAYWLNAYNHTLLRELARRPRSGHLLRHRRMFRRAAHHVGGRDYSLDVIEHGLLRGNRRPPYGPRRLLSESDPRLEAAPSRPDPRIHFALNCGARSCPPIRVYTAAVDSELERAARAYLDAESEVDSDGSLTLPGLMKLYRGDFGGREGVLAFAIAHLQAETAARVSDAGTEVRVRYSRFDWKMEAPGGR